MEAPLEKARPASVRRGLLARFAKDRRGVAALEFGMISIPFLGLLCAIFETAFVYYNHVLFDNAVANVARQILVGQYSTDAQSASDFKSATGANGYSLCGANGLPSYFNCNNVILNISTPSADTFSSLSGTISNSFINNPSTNITVPAAGAIVVLQAYYPMPIYLSVLLASGANGASNLYSQSSSTVRTNPVSGAGMVHDIYSVMVFRNEPQ